jgi:hypothetical protein
MTIDPFVHQHKLPNIDHESALARARSAQIATEAALSALAEVGLARIWCITEVDPETGQDTEPPPPLCCATLMGGIRAACNIVADTLVPHVEDGADIDTRMGYVDYLSEDVTWAWWATSNPADFDFLATIGMYRFIVTSPQGKTYWQATWQELLP